MIIIFTGESLLKKLSKLFAPFDLYRGKSFPLTNELPVQKSFKAKLWKNNMANSVIGGVLAYGFQKAVRTGVWTL